MNRVVRSTNVPIAELPSPMIRSPSQCPGTARSSASAGRSLIHDVGADKLLAATTAASPRHAQRPPGAQACRQLAAQRPPPLDIQRLVDGLVRDPHRCIVWILYPDPMGDLLRAPRRRPRSVLAAAMTAPTPGAHVRARHRRPVLSHDRACKAVLHVAPQPIVRGAAWLSSGAWHVGRGATAPSTLDTPGRRSESLRCAAALARQSTRLDGAAGRCRVPRRPELSRPRFLPAQQKTRSELIGAPR